MDKNINNIHDSFFKSTLSDKQLAKEFLNYFLPERLVALFWCVCQMRNFKELEGTFIHSAVLCQKYNHQPDELIQQLERIKHTFGGDKVNFFKSVFVYIVQIAKIKEQKVVKLLDQVPTDLKKDIMTTYEQIEHRGLKKGLEQAKINTILNGYKKGHAEEIIADFAGVSVNEVRKVIREHGSNL